MLLLLALSQPRTAGDGEHVHRLFHLGELAYYDAVIEASLSRNEGGLPVFERRTIRATVRVKTAGIREGRATQYLTIEQPTYVVNEGGSAAELDLVKTCLFEAKVENAGVVEWRALCAGKEIAPPWVLLGLTPPEWTPPMPDRLLAPGDTYAGTAVLPLEPFVSGAQAASVRPQLTFTGTEGQGETRGFRIYRNGAADMGEPGQWSAKLSAGGNYLLDAATGRITSADLSWYGEIMLRSASGPVNIDVAFRTKMDLMRVGAVGEQ